jgi:hypothetical protein
MVNLNPITSAIDLKSYFRAGSGKVPGAGMASAARGEVVEFSTISGELKNVKDVVDPLPDVRLDKVEEIKRKIKLNDYPLENNIDATLKKLMSNHIVMA